MALNRRDFLAMVSTGVAASSAMSASCGSNARRWCENRHAAMRTSDDFKARKFYFDFGPVGYFVERS
jgi:hypothetical protein